MLKKYSNISTDITHNRTQNHINYFWVVSFPHQLKREREVKTSMSANYICSYDVKIFSRAHAYKVFPHNIRQQPGNSLSLEVLSLIVKMDFSVFIYCNLLRLGCYSKLSFYVTIISLENHYLPWKQKAMQTKKQRFGIKLSAE